MHDSLQLQERREIVGQLLARNVMRFVTDTNLRERVPHVRFRNTNRVFLESGVWVPILHGFVLVEYPTHEVMEQAIEHFNSLNPRVVTPWGELLYAEAWMPHPGAA